MCATDLCNSNWHDHRQHRRARPRRPRTAERTGFRTQTLDQLTLQVGQTARVDVRLQVRELSETIDGEASAALLQTENSTVGTVIDGSKIVDLPLDGRNFVQLAQLIPGVQPGTPGSITVRRGRGSIGQTDSPFGSTAMSANGSRDTANRYFIDGIEFMDYDAMTYALSPSVDSLAEFKVETSTYSAESGALTGAPNVFFNNPFASAQVSGALNFAVSNDQNLRDSYIQQWNMNIQKKVRGNLVFDVGYAGSKGARLIVTFEDLNRPIAIVDPRTPGLPSLNARRPNQAYQRNVRSDKSIGNSIYHALQMEADRRMAKGFTMLAAYTWSKSISGPNDTGGQVGVGNFIGSTQDIYDLRSDRAVSGFDVTQRFVGTVLYDIPFFKSGRGFTRFVLRGWQVATIVTAQSGSPSPVTVNVDTSGVGANSRPDWVSGQNGNLSGSDRTWKRWFNTAAFTEPQFGRFGTSPRTNAFRLPGLLNADFSVNKNFRFTEQRSLEFRTEIFNLFNHFNPDPGTVDRNLRSATFGSVGGGVQGITTRVIQLGVKLYF